jgi:glycolate dehydrogenase FAD-linked subunit
MNVESLLADAVGPEHVLAAGPELADYGHDEALRMRPGEPAFVVKPGSTAEVARVLRIAGEQGLAVTARGSGTGLSGAAIPRPGGLVLVRADEPDPGD